MSTPKIVWKDRNTAALDLIQVAKQYPYTKLSIQALDALQAIRSDVIADELLSISLDSGRTYWERVYALRAYTSLSDDRFTPQIRSILEEDFKTQESILQEGGLICNLAHWRAYHGGKFADVVGFVDAHRSNWEWFFEYLDQANPPIVHIFLRDILIFYTTEDMKLALLKTLLKLLDRHPDLIDISTITSITDFETEAVEAWVEKHFGRIVQVCLSSELQELRYLRAERLKAHLATLSPVIADMYIQGDLEAKKAHEEWKGRSKADHEDDSIWKRCKPLYQQAKSGAPESLTALCQMATDEQEEVLVRATATHFLGKLQHEEGIIEILCSLVLSSQDRWRHHYSPVRFEAGEALCYSASPKAWEAILSAILYRPHNELYLNDWLTYLTDQLSGIHTAYAGSCYSNRGWINLEWDMQLVDT